jgi:hypothetical protein
LKAIQDFVSERKGFAVVHAEGLLALRDIS